MWITVKDPCSITTVSWGSSVSDGRVGSSSDWLPYVNCGTCRQRMEGTTYSILSEHALQRGRQLTSAHVSALATVIDREIRGEMSPCSTCVGQQQDRSRQVVRMECKRVMKAACAIGR